MKKLILMIGLLVGIAFAQNYQDGLSAFQQQKYQTAYDIWLPLSERGDALAQYNIGVLYENGYGVPKDTEEAFEWYQKSANSGYDKVQFSLGNAYSFGIGVRKDKKLAQFWWEKAAKQGLSEAQYHLGVSQLYSKVDLRNKTLGLEWLKKSVKQDYAPAKKILAFYKKQQKKARQQLTNQYVKNPKKVGRTFSKPKKPVRLATINDDNKLLKIKKKLNKNIKIEMVKKASVPIQKSKSEIVEKSKNQAVKQVKVVAKKLKTKESVKENRIGKIRNLADILGQKNTKKTIKLKSNWLIADQSPKKYTIQVTVQPSKKAVKKFIKRHKFNNARSYQVGNFHKVIVGSHDTIGQALKALKNLPEAVKRDRPWAKSFETVHKERAK